MLLTRILSLASLLATLLLTSATHAQAPAWQTATAITISSTSTSEILHTATDASGNVLVAGEFQGGIALGSTVLTSPTVHVPFVAKWNTASGTWAWATKLSATETTFAGGLAVVGSSIYLSGSFKGTATAGSLSLSSPASYNTYVAKLTDAGTAATWVWAQQAGGSADDFGNGLAAQGGSVYTVGLCYSTTLTFGALTVATPTAGSTFVAKLTDNGASGSYTWALVPSGPDFAWLRVLAVQGSSVYATGEMQGTKTFGTTTLTTSGVNDPDVLLTKITDAGPTGTWAWAQRAGGTGSDRGVALAASSAGVYLLGDFTSAPALFGTTTLANAGDTDVFVAKLTDAGTTSAWAWAQRAGGTSSDLSKSLVVRGSSVYIAGQLTTAPATFGTFSLAPAGTSAAFVARLADAGSSAAFAWALAGGSPTLGVASALASSGSQVYVGGATAGTATFGTQTTTGPTSGNYGFLAAITDAAALPTLAPTVLAEDLALFPNPASRATTVQLPAGLAAGPGILTVLDVVGRVVRTRTTTVAAGTQQATLDVAGLPPGVYTLRVAVGEHLGTARLVVE